MIEFRIYSLIKTGLTIKKILIDFSDIYSHLKITLIRFLKICENEAFTSIPELRQVSIERYDNSTFIIMHQILFHRFRLNAPFAGNLIIFAIEP